MNKIEIIFNGFSKNLSENVMAANCTTTLIRGNNTCVIVDTRTAWDGDELKLELANHGISPDDITHVVCTHGHSDHTGCNYLFLNAKEHIVGHSISNRIQYKAHDFSAGPYELDKGINVIATPGHTLDSISVIVKDTNLGKIAAICGDLFENVNDCSNESIWIDAGSESETDQRKERIKIAQMANVIIPGHGEMFQVNEEIHSLLQKQCEK